MSLYEKLTIKEWLALNCTEDIEKLLRKALKDNDEPMAILTLTELRERGNAGIAKRVFQEAVDAGFVRPNSHFSVAIVNSLRR